MAWTGMNGQDSTFDALLPMLKASTSESEAAVEPWVIPVNNLLSADRDGHISFKVRGRVIERPHEHRWIPVPAETSEDWSNLVYQPQTCREKATHFEAVGDCEQPDI